MFPILLKLLCSKFVSECAREHAKALLEKKKMRKTKGNVDQLVSWGHITKWLSELRRDLRKKSDPKTTGTKTTVTKTTVTDTKNKTAKTNPAAPTSPEISGKFPCKLQ